MSHKVLVIGSVAFDVIFSVSQDFRAAIPLSDGQIKTFNASYTAEQKKEVPGGNGANIAFWMSEEGVSCSLFSAFGRDFTEKGYRERLTTRDIEIRGAEGEFTAHAYMISDPVKQQMAIWQANDWEAIGEVSLTDFYSVKELQEFDYAIFSVLPPQAMQKHITEFRSHNSEAMVLFDPGQVTSLFDAETFGNCLEHSDVLLGNEVEFEHFWNLSTLLHSYPDPAEDLEIPSQELEHKVFIKTLGDQGCCVQYGVLERCFPGAEVGEVVEATGAGDAFRAGLLAELAKGKSLTNSIAKANQLGAECVQILGPQRP